MTASDWRPDFADPAYFAGYSEYSARFSECRHWPELADLNRLAEQRGIVNERALPVRFEHQARKCGQRQYEDGIHATGRVPTRQDSWHDFFNALVWLAWPRAKAALNSVQHHALGTPRDGLRGPLSDAATLFDESGLVLVAPDSVLASLLRAKRWHAAFWDERPRWQVARLYVFGHSLLEKRLARTPGITGKCLFVHAETLPAPEKTLPAWLDERVAGIWRNGRIQRPSELFPLPLPGVPGFDPANADPAYYEDERVFRPPPCHGLTGSDFSQS